MSSPKKARTGENAPAKRQKTSNEDLGVVDAAETSSDSPLESLDFHALVTMMTFLSGKDCWMLEVTSTFFRCVMKVIWKHHENNIIPAWKRLKKGPNHFHSLRAPGMARPISIPKIRINKFIRLSKFAARMEHQTRLHLASDSTNKCDGCLDFPDTDANVFSLDVDYDYFFRIAKLGESLNESKVLWEGFLALGVHTDRGGEYIYEYPLDSNIHAELSSLWPELFSFLNLPAKEREAAMEATFKDIAVTAVAMNRYYPTGTYGKPVKLVSTRGVQSLRLNSSGEIRAEFHSHSVQSHGTDEDESESVGSGESFAESEERNAAAGYVGFDLRISKDPPKDADNVYYSKNRFYLTHESAEDLFGGFDY